MHVHLVEWEIQSYQELLRHAHSKQLVCTNDLPQTPTSSASIARM